jgi:hypothetical protein
MFHSMPLFERNRAEENFSPAQDHLPQEDVSNRSRFLMKSGFRAWILISFGIVLAAFAAFLAVRRAVTTWIESAIGPHGSFREFRIGFTGIEILGLKIDAPPENSPRVWPNSPAFQAERILIEPSIVDSIASGARLRNLRIERPSITALRNTEGRIVILPGILGKTQANEGLASGKPDDTSTLKIDKLEIVEGTVDFIDASIQTRAHHVRIEKINASFGKIRIPDRSGMTLVDLSGIVKGARNDGKLTLSGSIELSTLESGITARLRGIDLTLLQPYFLKKGLIKKGKFDFDVKSAILRGKLNAPGKLTITGLELSNPASSPFIGMPPGVAVTRFKDRLGKISLNFVIKGDLKDPEFSLSEDLAIRIRSSMADYLGISLSDRGASGAEKEAARRLMNDVPKNLK